jgi:hypothetical protein
MKTVYDQCTETVPVSCTRNVYETCYRDECYTVCKPVYHDLLPNMHLQRLQAGLPDLLPRSHLPCSQAGLSTPATVNVLHGLQTGLQTCYRTVCYNVCKPVYQTCYKEVCCTTYKTETETCYKDVCYTVCKPVTESHICSDVCSGEWMTETRAHPRPVVKKCVATPATHAARKKVQVQCPSRTVCCRKWCPKVVQKTSPALEWFRKSATSRFLTPSAVRCL